MSTLSAFRRNAANNDFSAPSINKITPNVGAEIIGVDLSGITDEQIEFSKKSFDLYSALLFRGQDLSYENLVDFSKQFGELDEAPINEKGKTAIEGHPELYVVSNIKGPDGEPIGSLGAGEAAWHTDMSYLENPPDASILYALEVPEEGGDTWICGMYAALDSLPASLRAKIERLKIKHDGTYNSGGYLRQGFEDSNDPMTAPGTFHPAICIHPRTARPVLYLGRRRNAYINGLTKHDSDALLDALWDHATQDDHCFAHKWKVGDLLMWDNRTTLHKRDSFDPNSRRLMLRTQVKGKEPPVPVP